ncbi:hypothetical protein [uncultured Flavobacterium sp.]|uniref:hypothetical protein n=1 Tax=uncultured Flavobacterium sp. TaxID=165435 RepID=UPI003081ABDD
MKNLLLLFSALTLLLTSCSNDDNNSSEDKSILPKIISYTYPSADLGTNSKNTIAYNGNKIVSVIDEDSKTLFTYDGDLIIKQEQFRIDQQANQSKSREVLYTYENGKLKTRTYRTNISAEYPEGNYTQKTVYTHTSNNLISYIDYLVDGDPKVEIKLGEGTLTYEVGNLVKELQKVNSVITTRVYEYDKKNNPLKNILGYNLLLNEISELGKNNVIKTTVSRSDYPNSFVFLTTFTYNDKGYPIKHTSFDGGGKSIEYEIEYTY